MGTDVGDMGTVTRWLWAAQNSNGAPRHMISMVSQQTALETPWIELHKWTYAGKRPMSSQQQAERDRPSPANDSQNFNWICSKLQFVNRSQKRN